MIRPATFGHNAQTAPSNRFQRRPLLDDDVLDAARREFDGLAAALDDAGVAVYAYDDLPQLQAPDAVFPNNWVSFHADGSVVLYPLLAPNRRSERRADIVGSLATEHGFRVALLIDLSHYEQRDWYLEGTGSMVLDRIHRVAYACLSPRTQPEVLAEFARQKGYQTVTFNASDVHGTAVYHTNVVMSVGTNFAVLCADAMPTADRRRVSERLEETGRVLIQISRQQMSAFAGNVLELANSRQQRVLAMSERARESLSPLQCKALEVAVDDIRAVPIPVIEDVGGGGVRCMLAEIHLPKS